MSRSLVLLLAIGCSESKTANDRGAELNGAEPPAQDAETRVSLRVDVIPSQLRESEALDAAFRALPQSVDVQDLLVEDVQLEPIVLAAPQRQVGTVSGYRVNPAIADLPGETVAVGGTVRIRQPGSIQSYADTTDELGAFEAWVVPGDGYRLEVVPDDPLLPVLATDLVVADRPVDVELGAGVPIYGFVRSAAGPMEDARVHVVDPQGVRSATAVTDENGLYQVRVTPGTWTVVSEGRGLGQDPVLTLPPVEVDDDGAHVDVTYPTDLSPVLVQGRVVDPDGDSVTNATVRFVAESLDGYDGLEASWVAEKPVGADSTFLGYVVPGTYTIEVLPPAADDGQPDFSPLRRSAQVLAADAQLDLIELEPLRQVEGRVTGSGRGLAGAQVTCAEVGFDERFWTTFTDDRGDFAVDLPRVPLACEVVPPGDEPGFAPRWLDHDPATREPLEVALRAGNAVRGRIETEDGPEEFAVIEILDLDQRRIGFGFTDGRGEFEIRVDLDQARVSGL